MDWIVFLLVFLISWNLSFIFIIYLLENYKNYTDKAKRQAFKSKNEFSWDKMKNKISELLDKYIPEFPKEVKLSFPTIKKIELPKKETING